MQQERTSQGSEPSFISIVSIYVWNFNNIGVSGIVALLLAGNMNACGPVLRYCQCICVQVWSEIMKYLSQNSSLSQPGFEA